MLLAHQKVRFLEVGSSTDDQQSEELEVDKDKFLKKIRKLEVRDDRTKDMLLSVLTRSKPEKKKKLSVAEAATQQEMHLISNFTNDASNSHSHLRPPHTMSNYLSELDASSS